MIEEFHSKLLSYQTSSRWEIEGTFSITEDGVLYKPGQIIIKCDKAENRLELSIDGSSFHKDIFDSSDYALNFESDFAEALKSVSNSYFFGFFELMNLVLGVFLSSRVLDFSTYFRKSVESNQKSIFRISDRAFIYLPLDVNSEVCSVEDELLCHFDSLDSLRNLYNIGDISYIAMFERTSEDLFKIEIFSTLMLGSPIFSQFVFHRIVNFD